MLNLSRRVLPCLLALYVFAACASAPVPDSDSPDSNGHPAQAPEHEQPPAPDESREPDEAPEQDDAPQQDETPDQDAEPTAPSGETPSGDEARDRDSDLAVLPVFPGSEADRPVEVSITDLSFDDPSLTDALRRERARLLAAQRVANMSLDEQIGQMIMPAYIFDTGTVPVRAVTDRIRTELADVQPGGLILFGQNIADPVQTSTFIAALQALSSTPLFVAVDQEGGVVSRLTNSADMTATRFPSAQVIGRTGNPEYAFRVGQAIARELRALGINMNLAPVADVLTNPANTVIGSRAFGTDPHRVSDMVEQMIAGLQSEHVLSVVKHFPGHGDSYEDSHVQRVVIPHDRERLETIELLPFRRAIATGVDGIMSAHIDVPNVFGSDLPVTLSRAALEELLRQDMEFDGLIVTDSLVMEAVTSRFSTAELAVAAVDAGSDILLQPRNAVVARNAIRDAVAQGVLTANRIEASAQRILEAKYLRGLFESDRWLPEDQSALGTEAHRALVEDIRASAQ